MNICYPEEYIILRLVMANCMDSGAIQLLAA